MLSTSEMERTGCSDAGIKRRYKLLCTRKGDGVGGVGVMIKEYLCKCGGSKGK